MLHPTAGHRGACTISSPSPGDCEDGWTEESLERDVDALLEAIAETTALVDEITTWVGQVEQALASRP